MNPYEEISLEVIEHYLNTGKYNEVIELVKEQIPSDINNCALWYMLGYSHYAIGKYDEAIEQLHEAINLGYDVQVVFPVLGHLFMETEQWQEAEAFFLEVLRLNPSNADTHASYAKLMRITGHRKKSKFFIEKAMELNSESIHVLRNYFTLEGLSGNKKQRILALQQYMNSADSELAKLLKLGWNASLQHKEKEAKEYYRQAFLLTPEDKALFSILEGMEISAHPLLGPNRIINRMGGIVVVWITMLLAIFPLELFGLESLINPFLQLLLFITLYIFISIPLVKGLERIKNYRHR
ncbi:MAG: tetratricopeptide repeat protein [Lysinibacillus sp.]